MVKLKNKLRQSRVFNLEHDRYCSDGECYCTLVKFDNVIPNYKTGDHNYVRRDKKMNTTLRMLDREVVDNLPNTVLKCREIESAIRLGTLQVLEQKSEKKFTGSRAGSSGNQGKGSSKKKTTKSDEPGSSDLAGE